ncbi:hypothetical protein [Bacteroides neonati]|uniref:hypothetical protein n=1 Tax=Bacteroides neonati TaxID=1347393 RepID=UPI0004BBBFE7|nr:hypothetical protein [Bacteroides neonati]
MKTDNKKLQRSIETVINDPALMDSIKSKIPNGSYYANSVIEAAVDLSKSLESFYHDPFLGNYGLYPFLNVIEYHLEEGGVISSPVIVASDFDVDLFVGLIRDLDIPKNVKNEIEAHLSKINTPDDNPLDFISIEMYKYIEIVKYLTNKLNQLKSINNDWSIVRDSMSRLEYGGSLTIQTSGLLSKEELTRRIKRWNRRQGKSLRKFIRIVDCYFIPIIVIECCKRK